MCSCRGELSVSASTSVQGVGLAGATPSHCTFRASICTLGAPSMTSREKRRLKLLLQHNSQPDHGGGAGGGVGEGRGDCSQQPLHTPLWLTVVVAYDVAECLQTHLHLAQSCSVLALVSCVHLTRHELLVGVQVLRVGRSEGGGVRGVE